MCLPGGSGARGPDGSCSESHGEILSSRLVWESRDERSPPSDQKVGFVSPATPVHLFLLVIARLSPTCVFSPGLRELGVFLARKLIQSFCSSKQERICFGNLLLNSDSQIWIPVSYNIKYHISLPRHLFQMFENLSWISKERHFKGGGNVSITSLCRFQVERSCGWQDKASHINISRG